MKYPGGKGKCYQRLINLMPPHSTYIETHLGGGAVLRHKRPADVNIGIDVDAAVIDTWRKLNPSVCTLLHADAVAFLRQYAVSREVLVYADPPYLPECRRNPKIYRHEYSRDDHLRLLDVLVALPCLVMVSGYDSNLYQSQLLGWRKETFPSKTHVDVREECVWMNFPPPTALHDPSFLGDTFRDRQTIQRRHDRLVEKFDRMDGVERGHVLEILNSRFGGKVATL